MPAVNLRKARPNRPRIARRDRRAERRVGNARITKTYLFNDVLQGANGLRQVGVKIGHEGARWMVACTVLMRFHNAGRHKRACTLGKGRDPERIGLAAAHHMRSSRGVQGHPKNLDGRLRGGVRLWPWTAT
jgi:hypothetical protein